MISDTDSRRVWIVTDGKIGDLVQCRGIARELARDVQEFTVPRRLIYDLAAPWVTALAKDRLTTSGPSPDILIASGRRAIPLARAARQTFGARIFIVILKDPKCRADFADLIWAPRHDRMEGDNIFSTLTSPHGLADKIAEAKANPRADIAAATKPMLGVLLGGVASGVRYDTKDADGLVETLKKVQPRFRSVAMTPSRRTPPAFIETLRAEFASSDFTIWDGQGDNPYIYILANADALLVAGDSHNMVSEAAATTAPLMIWRPRGLAPKLDWFLDQMVGAGRVSESMEHVSKVNTQPIDATPLIAAEIHRRIAIKAD